jgi:hypothetical protein
MGNSGKVLVLMVRGDRRVNSGKVLALMETARPMGVRKERTWIRL